jgi:hypothetical protein
MPKTAAILALTLMLLTGLVLGQLLSLGPTQSAALPETGSDAAQTAERFYAAINAVLESGDASSLRAILHPSFVDHAPAGEDSGTARDLESDLLALRAMFPGLRLESSSTISGGDMVASSLIAVGSAQADVSGIAVETQLTGPDFELLRVAGGMVVERWASAVLPKPPGVELLASVDVDRLPIERAIVLERFTFDASASRSLGDNKGTVIIVESGSIAIHLNTSHMDALAGTPPVPEDGELLTAGTIRLIPTGVPFRLKTPREQTASVLQVRTDALRPGGNDHEPQFRQEIAPGVIREGLAYGNRLLPNGGPFTLTMYQVTLWPQSSIVKHDVAAGEIAWVMDGAVHVDVAQGDVRTTTMDGLGARQAGTQQLATGQGITGYPGAEVTYRVPSRSPATILLITLALTGMNR